MLWRLGIRPDCVETTRSGTDREEASACTSVASPLIPLVLCRQPSHSVLRAVEVIADFVAEFEPGRYSGEDAASLVASSTRAERLCGAGKTLAANRVFESNRPALAVHPSAAHRLDGVTGESIGEAIDVLKLGQALEDQPGADEAYRSGSLSRTGAKIVAGAVERATNTEVRTRCVVPRDPRLRLRIESHPESVEGP
jgi:hypothetical protein